MSILKQLKQLNLISPPDYVVSQIQYEVLMGSVSYGVSDDLSDTDVYGYCVPYKDMVFPHLAGEIEGFGRHKKRFTQYEQHHINNPNNKRMYDLSIYNIVKYFQLCMENNPNMIDSLYVPQRCVLHCSQIAQHVRENRKLFLHAGAYHKFKGYSFSQKNKLKNKVITKIIGFERVFNLENENITFLQVIEEIEWRGRKQKKQNKLLEKLTSDDLVQYRYLLNQCKEPSKRKVNILSNGYDTKFGYHIVRLLNEIEQILIEGDIDLERDRERLKSIRRGEWSVEQLESYFDDKEKYLENLYQKTKLPYGPDEKVIKQLLIDCLEMHFGNLDKCVAVLGKNEQALRDIQQILDTVKL